MYRGRFAPSPTGLLHLGNARTALVAYWRARQQQGQFIMRVEDLDSARSQNAMIEKNLAELRYLGLDWDEGPDVGGAYGPYRQQERLPLYEQALNTLKTNHQVFACYLSRKDLRDLASAPHGNVAAYGARERRLNEQLRIKKQQEGKTPGLRFRVDTPDVRVQDVLSGSSTHHVGDFIVRRADGEWAYQLAVVVDDSLMRITEVVRGNDLLSSSAAQSLLYQAFNTPAPAFLHVPLLLDTNGERMAKRKGALTLSALKEAGVPAERVVGLLAYTLGLLNEPRELSAAAGTQLFNLNTLKKDAHTLTNSQLEWLLGGG